MFKRMKRSLPVLFALLLPVTVLPACGPASTSVPTPQESDIQTEEQAVYTALFDDVFGEPRMYVLRDMTSPGIEGVKSMDSIFSLSLSQLTGLEDGTADSFRIRNDDAYPVPADMDLGLPYVLLSDAEFEQIFSINTSGWDVFYTRYPDSPGLTTISRVGFNEDFTQALVYVGTMSYWLAGSGYYVLLEKSLGAWRVDQQVMAWIS